MTAITNAGLNEVATAPDVDVPSAAAGDATGDDNPSTPAWPAGVGPSGEDGFDVALGSTTVDAPAGIGLAGFGEPAGRGVPTGVGAALAVGAAVGLGVGVLAGQVPAGETGGG
jgi:hypothetical protein